MTSDQKEKTFEENIITVMDEHAATVGHIAIGWNNLHEKLGSIFVHIATPDDEEMGWAAWHSLRSDTAMRQMLGEVLTLATKRQNNPALEALKAVLPLMPAGDRNMGIHTPFELIIQDSGFKIVPDHATGHMFAQKLKERGADVTAQLAAFEARIVAAYGYVNRLAHAIIWGGSSPLPGIPPELLPPPQKPPKKMNRRSTDKVPPLQP
jgi:hypothetical protein